MKKTNFQSYIYGITLFFMTLSGFAQMPIFKRYYIADIPGLGWLANFYVTHLMHYIFAGIFIGLVVFSILNAIILKIKFNQMIKPITVKAILFVGLILTGILLMVKNFPGTVFPNGFIIALNLLHLLFCMGLLFSAFYHGIKKMSASRFMGNIINQCATNPGSGFS